MKYSIANGFSAAQDAETLSTNVEADSEVVDLQEQALSSEDEQLEPREQSYNALLQMLSGPSTVTHAKRKRKIRHRGSDEALEAPTGPKELLDRIVKASSNVKEDFDVDGSGQVVDEVDFVEDDAREFNVGDDEVEEIDGEDEDGILP